MSFLRASLPPVMGLAFCFAILLLSACAAGPNPDPDPVPQDVISGTITAPAGYDVQGTEIQLCFGEICIDREIGQSGSSATFSFEGLEEGTYQLTAFKEVSEGSFLAGCHGTSDEFVCTPTSISPPQQNAYITLTLVELPSPPGRPPEELISR